MFRKVACGLLYMLAGMFLVIGWVARLMGNECGQWIGNRCYFSSLLLAGIASYWMF